MRTITVEDLGNGTYAISTEFHDGIVYSADSVEEAVKKYEADRNCVVGVVNFWDDISGSSEQLVLSDELDV